MFTLPDLPYEFNSLEPYIDAQTMQIHYSKHHVAYIENLNKAISNSTDIQNKTIEEIIADLNSIPEEFRTTVRNHGGGHLNHCFFWESLAPATGQAPGKDLTIAIKDTFESFDNFKAQFEVAGASHFGSGWVWLVIDGSKKLSITTTPNQDNPLTDGKKPLLGIDVWEHAYYLHYQNRRAEYLKNVWNIINWSQVDNRYASN